METGSFFLIYPMILIVRFLLNSGNLTTVTSSSNKVAINACEYTFGPPLSGSGNDTVQLQCGDTLSEIDPCRFLLFCYGLSVIETNCFGRVQPISLATDWDHWNAAPDCRFYIPPIMACLMTRLMAIYLP